MRDFCRSIALVCAVYGFVLQEAAAAIVEIAVSGRIGVDDRDGLLPDSIQSGAPWSGLIRYDLGIAETGSDPMDPDPDPKWGHYFDAARPDGLSISVNVHGHTFYGGNGELQARVLNDMVFDPDKVFNWPSGDTFAMGGPMSRSPYLLDSSFIFFHWYDASGAALLNDDLPTSFDPFDFVEPGIGAETGLPTFSPIWIVIDDAGLTTSTHTIYYRVVASIEHAEVRVVPEPGTLPLATLILGVAACWQLVCLSHRRRRFSHSSDRTF